MFGHLRAGSARTLPFVDWLGCADVDCCQGGGSPFVDWLRKRGLCVIAAMSLSSLLTCAVNLVNTAKQVC